MLGEKALQLIKELDRNQGSLPQYNTDIVAEVSKDIVQMIEENHADAVANDQSRTLGSETGVSYVSTVRVRHASIKRNIRCLLAYHYNRMRSLRTMRWEFGSILPADVKMNLSSAETEWFNKYSSMLATYMRSIGKDGVNLTVDLKPPKNLYVEVKCLVDYGKFELNNGSVILLKKNSVHYLPRAECEELIRQGICEHIVH